LIPSQAADHRARFINRNTDHDPLLVTGISCMSDHRVEGDAATGQ